MRIEGKEYRTIWFENNVVKIIDQTKLPHQFKIKELKTVKDAINAIKIMEVRGAPLIGGTAAYGLALAVQENNDLEFIKKSSEELRNLGIKVVCETLRRSMRSQMREANKCNADFAIIVGEEEFANKTIQIKNLSEGKQESIKYQNLITYFKSLTF